MAVGGSCDEPETELIWLQRDNLPPDITVDNGDCTMPHVFGGSFIQISGSQGAIYEFPLIQNVDFSTTCLGGATFSSTHRPSDTFPVGSTLVTYTVSDDCGNELSHSFTVTVVCDDPPPATTLSWGANASTFLPFDLQIQTGFCPFSFTEEIFYNDIGATFSVADIEASTTCPGGAVEISVDPLPTDVFQEGDTQVTYTARDECGNVLTHRFTLTVFCAQSPPPPPPADACADLFSDFPWLGLIDFACNDDFLISVYEQGIFNFVHLGLGGTGALYFEDGTFYCSDSPGFSCVDAYGLAAPVTTCDCVDLGLIPGPDPNPGPNPSGPNPSDDYPWMTQYIDFDNCEGLTIYFYDFFGSVFPYFEVNGQMTLFSDTGQLYCTDSPPAFICPDVYGLEDPIDVWVCEDCTCPQDIDPVCDIDGNRYTNTCEALCAGVPVDFLVTCDTVTISVFENFPWLIPIVLPGQCVIGDRVTVYRSGIHDFIYFEPAGTIASGNLFNAQGQFYCADSPGFSCVNAYGFTSDDVVDSWVCGGLFPCGLDDEELFCEPWVVSALSQYEECGHPTDNRTVIAYISPEGEEFIFIGVDASAVDFIGGEIYDCSGVQVGSVTGSFGLLNFDPPEFADYFSFFIASCATGIPSCLDGEGSIELRAEAERETLSMTMYPNPASGRVHIEVISSDVTDASLHIMTLEGKVLRSIDVTSYQNEVSLSGMAPGLYLVELIRGADRIVEKLILIE